MDYHLHYDKAIEKYSLVIQVASKPLCVEGGGRVQVLRAYKT